VYTLWFNNATSIGYIYGEYMKTISSSLLLLFAIASGLSVANIYYAQPLLDQIALDFKAGPGSIGFVITLTQIGYALGLLLIVPLGDMFNRRNLIVVQLALSVLALSIVTLASKYYIFLGAMICVGLFAVVAQILVAFAANLSSAEAAGRAVGKVTSGIVIGILLARTVAGFLHDLGGWRAVYLFSTIATLSVGILLFRFLPSQASEAKVNYPELIRSTLLLFIEEPLLRKRAVLATLIFASFSVLWSSVVLPLSGAGHALSHSAIGMLGLAGVAGAIAAVKAGEFADRGYQSWTTGVGLTLLLLSWGLISFLDISMVALVLGIVVLDFAVQAVHVTNQSLIFPLRPGSQSRIVSCYMIFYSIGSGVGAVSATAVYAWKGWVGVCLLGASISLLALVFWLATLEKSPVARN
jgi:predicted MFS family arabinose efflux permease